MRANGYVIHVTPTIWSIVVESHALRKSWAVTMTVLGVVTKNVKQSVLNLWKKRCHSVDTSKQCHVARTRAECDKILPACSHRCQSRCGQPCTKQCQEYVKRTDWPCGHEVTIACSANPLWGHFGMWSPVLWKVWRVSNGSGAQTVRIEV